MRLGNAAGLALWWILAAGAHGACAADRPFADPVAKAVGDVVAQTSDPAIAGFRWGSPVALLQASKDVRPSAGFSAKCVIDFGSVTSPDCVAFVPTSGHGFARVYYATSRDGLLLVESNATRFDCAHFDAVASPSAGHRTELGRMGWKHLRRDRRPEGRDSIVETQLYVRDGIGVELTFIKTAGSNTCGVKSYVSKSMS